MAKSPDIHFLLLAAGESKRMGRIKQLLPWNNTTLLEHTINEALQSNVNKVNLVLGANSVEILSKIKPSNVDVFINKKWQNGIGSSIAYGIGEILRVSNPEAILIGLADQPFVNTAFYNQMLAKYKSDEKIMIASQYEKSYGVPALFGSHYYDSLLSLKGDEGAKKLILKFPDRLILMDGSEIHKDIDTIEMYKEALNSNK